MDFQKFILAHPIVSGVSSGVATFLLLVLGNAWIKNEKAKGNDTFLGYLLNGAKD